MQIYLAPLEGITTPAVRNAFAVHFPGMAKCFTPFIPPSKASKAKYIRETDPNTDKTGCLVPQIISKDAHEVLEYEKVLADSGYEEYNINLGCPSGTVTAKGLGSGMLRDTEKLQAFLEMLYSGSRLKVSIKTRIGCEDVSEWDRLCGIFASYPVSELIVHPRLLKEQYKGSTHTESYEYITRYFREQNIGIPLCYNGDITDIQSYEKVRTQFPETRSIMIGRGAIMNPGLIGLIMEGRYPESYGQKLREFHDDVFAAYKEQFSGENDVLLHMKELWAYMRCSYKADEKAVKRLMKAKHISEYKIAAADIMSSGLSI